MFDRFIFIVALLGSSGLISALRADEPSLTEKNIVEAADKTVVEAPLFGRITDELGKPVTDAQLNLTGPRYLNVKTDDQGRYAFLDLDKPGEYRLSVESQGWVGFTDYQEQVKIDLDPDRNTEKNFTLQRACKLTVKVVDENNSPVVASLFSYSVDHNRLSKTQKASTNQHGIATIGGIPRSKAKQLVSAQSGGFALARVYASVDDPAVIGEHTIVLKQGKTIRGKAICNDGNPATGWQIYSQPTWCKFGPAAKGVKISKDGSFELPDIGDDSQNVSIEIPLADDGTTFFTVMSDTVLTKLEQPINVKIDRPSPASMHYLTCNLRWIGKPAERGFQIVGYCQDLDYRTDQFIKSGAKQVKIGPMPAGIYRFSPNSGQIEILNLRGIKNLDKLDQVKVPNDKPIQIVVQAKGKPHLQGIVIDAVTKKPIKSYQMRVTKVKTLRGPNYVTGNEYLRVR